MVAIDIKEYSYILTVIDKGSISEAAEALYISQPSLSMYIKKLEERLNIKFFNKSAGKMHLTDAGASYIEYARQIVALDAAMHSSLADIADLNEGHITMGVTATRASSLLPIVLPAFKKKHPSIDVRVVEATSRELEEMLLERKLDFAVLNQPLKPLKLEYRVLNTEEVVLLVHKDNPVIHKAVRRDDCPYPWMALEYIMDEPFILLKSTQRMRQAAEVLFANAGSEPNVLMETASAFTAYFLTSAGLGLTILTDTFCKTADDDNIRFFSIGQPRLTYEVVVAYPSEMELSRAATAMIKTLEEQIGNQ